MRVTDYHDAISLSLTIKEPTGSDTLRTAPRQSPRLPPRSRSKGTGCARPCVVLCISRANSLWALRIFIRIIRTWIQNHPVRRGFRHDLGLAINGDRQRSARASYLQLFRADVGNLSYCRPIALRTNQRGRRVQLECFGICSGKDCGSAQQRGRRNSVVFPSIPNWRRTVATGPRRCAPECFRSLSVLR